MLLTDHLLAALLIVALPLYGRWEFPRFVRAVNAGNPHVRRRQYHWTMAMHLGVSAATLAIWLVADRDLAALGVSAPRGWGFWASLAAAGLVIAFFLWQLMTVARSAEAKAQLRAKLGDLGMFLPHTERELRAFSLLSLTAMLEELLYRGFLIWYAAQFVPLWVALLATSAAFGAAHLYQGPVGAAQTGAAGLVLGGLYLLSGSLWVPMLLHGATDLLQGRMVYQALRENAGHRNRQGPAQGLMASICLAPPPARSHPRPWAGTRSFAPPPRSCRRP